MRGGASCSASWAACSVRARPCPCSLLCSYVDFFAKHQPVPEVDPQQDKLMWSVSPAFVLDLVECEGARQLHHAHKPLVAARA